MQVRDSAPYLYKIMPLLENTLKPYINNNLFIETGTFQGIGVKCALIAGYKQIVSIELSERLYNLALEKYKFHPNVKLVSGDSSKVLGQILKYVNEPVTFWLDAHYCEGESALGDVNSPLMFELEIIKNHHIKTHTILIDDMRCWTNPVGEFDKSKVESNKFDREIIERKLLEINSNYKFEYIDHYIEKDILVAKI